MSSALRRHFWLVDLGFAVAAVALLVALALSLGARVTGLPLEAPAAGSPDGQAVEQAAPARLSVKLLGTLVADDPAFSLATIQDLADRLQTASSIQVEVERNGVPRRLEFRIRG